MERLASASASASAFVKWEEVYVSSGKGRREVHYYLKRKDGTSDLAVVGKEKSLRHMSYHYAIRDRSLLSISPYSSLLKLRSRREVIDWLNTIVPDSPHQSSQAIGGFLDSKDACKMDIETLKDVPLRKLGHNTTEFVWLGSPWTCRKRRRHYQSFRRNGVNISIHAFIYVLAEEDKRLVAYLDDMYEDSRGNKMVVVRWFHKIDEVGIVLPQNYNDREIFFSLCLQDLNIECIDGLATVLSPQHYERFLNEAKHTQLEPFICSRQFDNDDVKPFDITQIKGYWKQEILRYMYNAYPSKDPVKSRPSEDGLKAERNLSDGVGMRPRKRLRRSKDGDLYMHPAINKQESLSPCLHIHGLDDSLVGSKVGTNLCSPKDVCSAACRSVKQDVMEKSPQDLTIGSQVEVLSQDSGLRGCWFRALVIKKHKDKVKLRYRDIKDAADEADSLEEWVLASKVAVPDSLGLQTCRTAIRPTPPPKRGNVSPVIIAGTAVDVWWHDGWWEGIVLEKETEDKIRVYFPGEKQESIFGCSDLRPSQEWLGNGWERVKERPDLVASILSDLRMKEIVVKTCHVKAEKTAICDGRRLVSDVHKECMSLLDEIRCSKSQTDSVVDKVKELEVVRDLSKDSLLAQLRWNSSGRRRRGNPVQKLHHVGCKNKSSPEAVGTGSFDGFFVPQSLKVDHDICKYIGDNPFSSSVVSPLTSLVMSR